MVGAALEKRQLLDNEALNFLNTLVGALVAAAFAVLSLRSSSVQALPLLAARAAVHPAAAAAAASSRARSAPSARCTTRTRPRRVTWSVVLTVILGSLCASFMNAASNAINQIYDLEIDRLNKPSRPLVTGALSRARGLDLHLDLLRPGADPHLAGGAATRTTPSRRS